MKHRTTMWTTKGDSVIRMIALTVLAMLCLHVYKELQSLGTTVRQAKEWQRSVQGMCDETKASCLPGSEVLTHKDKP